ncbi:hypothetical protein H4R34_002076 [Dimargaris verticillata]|uniref:Uncharacterized protein n=1 Tax=Dimargaris verticillata TaxID=2761393 RepID=A0A9W8B9I2_9FUNG|nr:hypothetical protein H4R34_002076 [Dimargaris verticillata]
MLDIRHFYTAPPPPASTFSANSSAAASLALAGLLAALAIAILLTKKHFLSHLLLANIETMVRTAVLFLAVLGCSLSPQVVEGGPPSTGAWTQRAAGKSPQGMRRSTTNPVESPATDDADWPPLRPRSQPLPQKPETEPLPDRSEKESWEPSDDESLDEDPKGYQPGHGASSHEQTANAKDAQRTESSKVLIDNVQSTASADLDGQHKGGHQYDRNNGAYRENGSNSDLADVTYFPLQLDQELKDRNFQRKLFGLRALVGHLSTSIILVNTDANRIFLTAKQNIVDMVRANRWSELHHQMTRHVRAAATMYRSQLIPATRNVYQLLREINPEYFAVSVDDLLPSHYPWVAYHGLFSQEKDLRQVSGLLTTYIHAYQHILVSFRLTLGVLYEFADHFRQMKNNETIRERLSFSVSAMLTEANRMGRELTQHAQTLSDAVELKDIVTIILQHLGA